MTIKTKDVRILVLYAVIAYLLLKHTNTLETMATNVAAIPQQLGVTEGLKSAYHNIKN